MFSLIAWAIGCVDKAWENKIGPATRTIGDGILATKYFCGIWVPLQSFVIWYPIAIDKYLILDL